MIKFFPYLLRRYLETQFGVKKPLRCSIALTYKCNSKCKTCDIWKIYRKCPDKQTKELTKEEWFNFFGELKNDLLWIDITGGEPFLNNDLNKIFKYIIRKTKIYSVNITSNCLLGNKIVEKTKEMLKEMPLSKKLLMGVSIDGYGEAYKKVRGVQGFDIAIQTYLKLKKLEKQNKNFKLHLSYVISKYNNGNLEKFYSLMKTKYGLNIEEFSVVINSGGYFHQLSRRNLNINKCFGDLKFYLSELKKTKPKDFVNKLRRNYYIDYANFVHEKKSINKCKAMKTSFFVDPYGNIYPCMMWLVPIGNIKNQSFYKIWDSKKAEMIRKAIKEKKCPGCIASCELQHNWLTNPLNVIKAIK